MYWVLRILATELGDETFIIAAVMSMRHPKFTAPWNARAFRVWAL